MNDFKSKPRKITVSIAGISYQLLSLENEEYTIEIAKIADLNIKEIYNMNASLSVSQATVLALVNSIDLNTKLNAKCEDAIMKAKVSSDAEMKIKEELFAIRDNDFEIKKELLRVNELNKMLELEIAALRTASVDYDSQTSNEISDCDDIENEIQSLYAIELQDETEDAIQTLCDIELQDETEDAIQTLCFIELQDETEAAIQILWNIESQDEIENELPSLSESNEKCEALDENDLFLDASSHSNEIMNPEEIDEIVRDLLGGYNNPFASPKEEQDEEKCEPDNFEGYKQATFEDLFS